MLHPLLLEQINESLATQNCHADTSGFFRLISNAYYRFDEQLAYKENSVTTDAHHPIIYANDHNHHAG